ncbi:hypothetical protein GCM10010447_06100 [Streptomyces fulvorobeus]
MRGSGGRPLGSGRPVRRSGALASGSGPAAGRSGKRSAGDRLSVLGGGRRGGRSGRAGWHGSASRFGTHPAPWFASSYRPRTPARAGPLVSAWPLLYGLATGARERTPWPGASAQILPYPAVRVSGKLRP